MALATKIRTEEFTAIGANIRGTPRMSAQKVRQDLATLKAAGDVIVTQEFKLDYYWAQYQRIFEKQVKNKWSSSPSSKFAYAHPVMGAQGVFWRKQLLKRIDTRKSPAFNFDISTAGIMDNRWIRSTLLEERTTGLRCWFGTTHFVVGGDQFRDSAARRRLMASNIEMLDAYLKRLERTGEPIWFELDANIARNSGTYKPFTDMLKHHNAKLHGEHGVEYCFTIDSHSDTKVIVTHNSVINTKAHGGKLNTDHEARCTKMYLAQR